MVRDPLVRGFLGGERGGWPGGQGSFGAVVDRNWQC